LAQQYYGQESSRPLSKATAALSKGNRRRELRLNTADAQKSHGLIEGTDFLRHCTAPRARYLGQ